MLLTRQISKHQFMRINNHAYAAYITNVHSLVRRLCQQLLRDFFHFPLLIRIKCSCNSKKKILIIQMDGVCSAQGSKLHQMADLSTLSISYQWVITQNIIMSTFLFSSSRNNTSAISWSRADWLTFAHVFEISDTNWLERMCLYLVSAPVFLFFCNICFPVYFCGFICVGDPFEKMTRCTPTSSPFFSIDSFCIR